MRPYEALYLGDIPKVGEGYAMLTQPYTLPATLLRTELMTFSAEQTGDVEDRRIVAGIGDTRVAHLSEAMIELFWHKWAVQWTRNDFILEDEDASEN